ncbi:MAG: anaerobic ribonucleoside-triphosphate reductase activating protein [Clostridia bacterium]|nr:anaerobic ribonucleoside-triphosphate reductase activating protein [Clostridia bacterium]
MVFGGIQKLTLLDFPHTVSCILFTKGCNFRCPFCHNTPLVVPSETENLTEAEILSFLKKRQGILDGVCITGGEPLIHPNLPDFIRKVKDLGYKVKLDTNGSFPLRLSHLIDEGLLDYVAMDVKNSFSKYPLTAGCDSIKLDDIEKSIALLLKGNIPYEFRTTVTSELHTEEDIAEICSLIKGADKYFIQNFVDSGDILKGGLHPMAQSEIEKMAYIAQNIVPNTKIR